MVFVVLKHLLISVRVRGDTLSSLERGLFSKFLLVRVATMISGPSIGAINVIGPLRLSVSFISVDELREALLVSSESSLITGWLLSLFMVSFSVRKRFTV